MNNSGSRTTENNPHPELPCFQELLDGTDWASLATPYGTGESLPAALTRLLDLDPAVRAAAAKDALDGVTHQNSIYEATVPVALYVAAILNHPATAAGEHAHKADLRQLRHLTRETLLDWLGNTAYDADDETVAIGERHFDEGFLDACPDIRAFRDLRPVIYTAVQPFLTDDNTKVRDAALVTAIPLIEHHALTSHRNELADHAHRLLSTSTDRHKRDRALDALNAWGYDISTLENVHDITARELRTRMEDHDSWWASNATGGYAEDPPF
ncbi:hypothetical protein OG890_22245 [Streptomyces anulatus]|uniref:hypothetical protein n=1 Tax=Streptomyces anulatus TaxID=1892 RepID=UPI0022534DA8|nr:hypothetical protein [Streptomyces anulatus]MCX4486621.1 hypothetical protein [Streptomyces anulatus]WSU78195.1 hypothetical protein OG499_36895 [Streptomyces anulatus]